MTMRFCTECGFQLDKTMESFKRIPISIAGSEGAGKSHFLSVLINEIRNNLGGVYDCTLLPAGGDDTMYQYMEHYYKPLFEENIIIPSTEQDYVRPLIYSLIFNKDTHGKSSTITFYDACGSNFRNERAMSDYNRSIINSGGIIMIIDPSQLPTVREEYIKQGRRVMTDDFSSLLSRTISLIRTKSSAKSLSQQIEIPVAVCISKIDLLDSILEPCCYLRYPSRHTMQPSFDILDHICYSKEMEAMIESWGGADIINQVKSQFKHYGFFGFSSLGSEPFQKKVEHISPNRVCDPFLWLMAKNQVITSKRHLAKTK